MFTKEIVRKQLIERRNSMSASEISRCSASITERLLSLTEYKEAKTILVYAAFRNEVITKAIVEDALANNKVVGMPKTYEKGIMEFYSIFDYEDLVPCNHGILEPPEEILVKPEEALIVVPGVAFDIHKNRIGYGGGYYDRYIKRYSDMYKIGLAYDFQIMDAIEVDEHDEAVDIVITEQQIII